MTPLSFEDFQPSFEWKQEEGSDTLVISLPGFKKEQLKVQVDNFGNLKVRGERPLSVDRWSRFNKDFRIPQNTSNADIRAKFENGNLTVIFPRLFARPRSQKQPTKAPEHESGKKTTTEPKPREDQDRTSQKDSPPSPSKVTGTSMKQSTNGTDAKKNAQKIEEEKKNQIHKSDDTKAASEIGDRDTELAKSRKRKAEDEKTIDGGSWLAVPKPKAGVLGMRFKRPRQLMLNVGVAAVIFVGLAIYVTYKLRKSIEEDSN